MADRDHERWQLLIVGVGASAGGLGALNRLLGAVDRTAASQVGLAFVVVQHLDPEHESMLPEILARHTALDVHSASDQRKLEPNSVYVIKPGTQITVVDDELRVEAQPTRHSVSAGIDHFFKSLAATFGKHCAGIVLSGTGRDGTSGLRAIKGAGGITLVQDPQLAEHPSMPRSVVDASLADLVLPVEEMPQALLGYADRTRAVDEEEALARDLLEEVAGILRSHESFDIQKYKQGTTERRIRRRIGLTGTRDPGAYVELLREDLDERRTLMREMLIGVTDFFRDPDAYEALENALATQLEKRNRSEPLRIWSVGCATGEEPYSLAIIAHERMRELGRPGDVQIFATDVDENALAVGRDGTYPETITDHVRADRLHQFFDRVDGGFRVKPQLRNSVSFATHDICVDPPFSGLDLISCRNLLIYLRKRLQDDVFRTFHFALRPEGHLFLGSSETTTADAASLFRPLSKRERIYQRGPRSRAAPLRRTAAGRWRSVSQEEASDRRPQPMRDRDDRADQARKLLTDGWVPPAVVVDGAGVITYVHGEISRFLSLPAGEPRLELLPMLEPELRTRVRAAVYKCRRDGEPVTLEASIQREHEQYGVRIRVHPTERAGSGLLGLSFEELEAVEARKPPTDPEEEALVEQLERELESTREDLRNTVEELETSNEELRAANEESTSVNEELQSTNEELEASTEELRSLNEELSTVNAQLKDKIDQVQEAHDDLNNFFASTQLATLFLDEGLRIKRFTPAARRLLRLEQNDLQRRVEDVNRELLGTSLETEARGVLDRLAPSTTHLETSEGSHYDRQVLPYRSSQNRIEGVVVTFTDITELKRMTRSLAQREKLQAVVAQLGLEGLTRLSMEDLLEKTARQVYDVLHVDAVSVLERKKDGSLLFRAEVGHEHVRVGETSLPGGIDSQAAFTLTTKRAVVVEDLESERRFGQADLTREEGFESGLSCLIGDPSDPYGVLLVHGRAPRSFPTDEANFLVSIANMLAATIRRRESEDRLELSREHFRLALRHSPTAFYQCDTELRYRWVGKAHTSFLPAEVLGKRDDEVMPPERATLIMGLKRKVLESGEGERRRYVAELPTGQEHWDITIEPLRDTDDVVTGLAMAVHDLTDLIEARQALEQATEKLARSERRFRSVFEQAAIGIALVGAQGVVRETNRRMAEILDRGETDVVEGTIFLDWVIPAHTDRVREVLSSELGEPTSAEVQMVKHHGGTVWAKVSSSPFDAGGDDPTRIVLVEDISERRRTEVALAEAAAHKDDFLAMLGHELRNPLAALRYSTDLLGTLAEEHEGIERIQGVVDRQVRQMHRLVGDLLDVSRIERGKLDLDRQRLDFAPVVEAAVEDARSLSESEGLTIELDLPAEEIWVDGDRVRLAQLVGNLLSNASKFTRPPGRVRVSLRREGDEAILEVHDDGIGMSADTIQRIFEPFRQLEQTLDRSRGGLGLGLSIVRGMVDLHGGEVGAESEGEGQGSRFWVRLPTVSPRSEAPGTERPGTGPVQQRVLLVDDHEDSLEIQRMVLEAEGYEVHTATNGKNALEVAQEVKPSVVFCDIGLPEGLSGYDVVTSLRDMRGLDSLSVVAVTGYGRAADRERALEAGFDEHLTKPVSKEELLDCLQRFDEAAEEG